MGRNVVGRVAGGSQLLPAPSRPLTRPTSPATRERWVWGGGLLPSCPSRNSQLATRNSQLATRNSQLATRNSPTHQLTNSPTHQLTNSPTFPCRLLHLLLPPSDYFFHAGE